MVTGLCLALLCAINLTGCNSGRGYQKADTATGQMEALKTELLAVKDRTEKIAPALKELVAAANSNPRSAYEKFSREFENTKKQSGKARRLADEIKKQAQAYFQAWEAQSSKVANPETRQRFEQRKTELAAQYEKIEEYAQRLETDYDAFIQDLNDIQLVLGVDLTLKGIESVADLVNKATRDAQTIDGHLDRYVSIVDQVATELRPSRK
jgi:chromosome segregation ATPase